MHKNKAKFLALGLSAALAGCGGGGGGGTSSTTAASALAAQGVYQGTTSAGAAFETVVLDDGSYYTLAGSQVGSTFIVYDLLQGLGSSNGSAFSSSDLRDFTYTGQTLVGTLSATVSPGVSISGNLTDGGASETFSGAAPPNSTYDYNAPADLSAIDGNWTMSSLQGASTAVTINMNGTFTGSSQGCSFNGTLTPRASGKNVFDVAVQFGPAPCVLANQSANGIALSYLLANATTRQLLVAAVDPTRTYGTVLFGQR